MRTIATSLLLLFLVPAAWGQAEGYGKDAKIWNILLGAGVVSAPSREAWLGAEIGTRVRRHHFMGHLLFAELAPSPRGWVQAGNAERSAQFAFAMSHRFDLLKQQRWTFFLTSMVQLQRISVYDGLEVNGIPPSFVRAYTRAQFSTGIGVAYSFSSFLQVRQAFRYGVALGQFFPESPIVKNHRLGLGIELGLEVRL